MILVFGNYGLFQSLYYAGSVEEYLLSDKFWRMKCIKHYFGDESDIKRIKEYNP